MGQSTPHKEQTLGSYPDDAIDFAELATRLRRGLPVTLGLACLGLALGIGLSLVATTKQSAVTSLRVTFSFPGFEKGNYPNNTKFQPDDVRAPDVVNDALRRLDIQDAKSDLASKIRSAIGISGLIAPNVIKERDKLRASGQNLPPFVPDEYEITLSLPRDYPIDLRQRELLLTEVVSAYQQKFRRTYVELPPEFGNALAALNDADFVEYELILTKETQSLQTLLEQQILKAKQFRSPTNNLSFSELLKQTELFTQLKLNNVLSLIYINGLSKDHAYALAKMDYYLRVLEDKEQRLKEEELVVTNLLSKTQERAQNYVLATKAQAPQSAQPLLDQGFIDTLLTNDAYNFLVRKALEAGLAVKRAQSEKAQLMERRQRMQALLKGTQEDKQAVITQTEGALADLKKSYTDLLGRIRVALEDYSRQEYSDAIRITSQPVTPSLLKSLILGALVGLVAGLSLGLGLSLLKQPARERE